MNRLIKYKIYLQRALIYNGIFNGVINVAILVKVFNLPFYFTGIVVVLGFCGLLFIGFIDYTFILEKENKIQYSKVPQMQELLNK